MANKELKEKYHLILWS